LRLVTVCVLDHGDDSVLKLVDPGRAQDVAVPKEIRADWTNRELVRLHRLHVNHDVACVVARDDPRVLDRVEVGDHRQPPTPNVEFVLHGVRQDVDDCLLLVVDEDELVVVPAGGQELIVLVLNDPVHELLRLVRQLVLNQLHGQGLLVQLHLDKVHAGVRAHDDLVGVLRHLECEDMANAFKLLADDDLNEFEVVADADELEPAFVLAHDQGLRVELDHGANC
jgi:hypothetical protein